MAAPLRVRSVLRGPGEGFPCPATLAGQLSVVDYLPRLRSGYGATNPHLSLPRDDVFREVRIPISAADNTSNSICAARLPIFYH